MSSIRARWPANSKHTEPIRHVIKHPRQSGLRDVPIRIHNNNLIQIPWHLTPSSLRVYAAQHRLEHLLVFRLVYRCRYMWICFENMSWSRSETQLFWCLRFIIVLSLVSDVLCGGLTVNNRAKHTCASIDSSIFVSALEHVSLDVPIAIEMAQMIQIFIAHSVSADCRTKRN